MRSARSDIGFESGVGHALRSAWPGRAQCTAEPLLTHLDRPAFAPARKNRQIPARLRRAAKPRRRPCLRSMRITSSSD
jgi:hypothetical protein